MRDLTNESGDSFGLRRRLSGTVVMLVALLAALLPAAQGASPVVINEIFYHPPCEANYTPCPDALAEFIEIYNPSGQPVDVSGWSFVDGVEYAFAPNTTLPAGGYLVIADDTAGFSGFFNASAAGQWSGGLSNSGERVALIDNQGQLVDAITYKRRRRHTRRLVGRR